MKDERLVEMHLHGKTDDYDVYYRNQRGALPYAMLALKELHDLAQKAYDAMEAARPGHFRLVEESWFTEMTNEPYVEQSIGSLFFETVTSLFSSGPPPKTRSLQLTCPDAYLMLSASDCDNYLHFKFRFSVPNQHGVSPLEIEQLYSVYELYMGIEEKYAHKRA